MSKPIQKGIKSAKIDTYLDTKSETSSFNNNNNIDPRTYFVDVIDSFPIDLYNIPRPFKSHRWNTDNITDHFCVIEAFRLLDVPHDSFIDNFQC